SKMKIAILSASGAALILLSLATAAASDGTLEQQLQQDEPSALVKAARQQGDATRGAIVFYQPQAGCTKCHAPGEPGNGLGPDLARRDEAVTDTYLIESLLQPSKVIRKGYEAVTLVTTKGLVITGLVHAETP